MMNLFSFILVLLYGLGIAVFWWRMRNLSSGLNEVSQGSGEGLFASRGLVRGFVFGLVVLHAALLYNSAVNHLGINLALGHVVSLVGLITVVVYILGTFRSGVLNLGAIVLPVGLIGLLVGQYAPGSTLIIKDAPMVMWIHLMIALLAFGFLCIATAQAILLYLQEKQLHKHQSLFPALPALETMEANLFDLTLMGALLLTANLVVGMISAHQLYGVALAFNHHIFLSFLAWAGFVTLLLGHKVYGWRGVVAAKWTIVAFLVLVLAYFGARFVSSVVLE